MCINEKQSADFADFADFKRIKKNILTTDGTDKSRGIFSVIILRPINSRNKRLSSQEGHPWAIFYFLTVDLLFRRMFQHRHKCCLWYFDVADHFHAFFAFFLLFEQFAFTANITAVTFCGDIFAHGAD